MSHKDDRLASQGNPREKRYRFKPGTIKRLFSYMAEYKIQMVLVVLSILLSSMTGATSAVFLQILIDDYIMPLLGQSAPVYTPLLQAVGLMGVIYLSGALANLFYNRTMAGISQETLKKIRDEMFVHMQSLPVKYFDTHAHGEVMSYYTNDVDTLRQFIAQSLPQLFSSLIQVITAFAAMMYLSLTLSLFVAVFVVFLLMIIRSLVGKSSLFFVQQQQSLGKTNGYIEEMINGQKVIKVFSREEKVEEQFNAINETLRTSMAAANTYGNIMMPIVGSMGYFLYVLLAIIGGAAGIAGIANISLSGTTVLSVGVIVSFLALSRSFINPLGQISMQFNMVVMALAGASRIFEMLDEPSEKDDGYVTLVDVNVVQGEIQEAAERSGHWAWKHPHSDGSVTYTLLQGDIRFHDVDFAYEESKTILHGITLYAEPGQKVAFVGATGAGKTTITNLINRFYDIEKGKISYDGINIKKIRKPDLRRSLGIVLQDVHLFTGTVLDNIRYGNLNASDEECIEAAKLANADSFIQMLPQGYHTLLSGDGSGLSQGQRQLISIARAAVANPPVMILDEATSSIDTRTETLLQAGMDSLMKGRTVFVISHRLSTTRNSDVIMVMDHGEIVERGNHDELIAKQGIYYRLYTGLLELD